MENLDSIDDKAIIDLYWSRDSSAITASQERYGGYCHQIAWNILRNQEDCEECINDTWLRAWNAMPDARPQYLAAFFGAITRRLSLDYYRKSHANKRGGSNMPLIYEELKDCLPTSDSDSMEQHLDSLALSNAINDFLASLNVSNRILFVRRYWYSDSIKDLSQNLHMSESRVKSALYRMRKKLKKHLDKEGIIL